MTKNVTISLPEELIQKIKNLARSTGSTFSGVVKVALNRELLWKTWHIEGHKHAEKIEAEKRVIK